MTTITFDRTGGVIGNDLHLDLNLDDLSEDEAQHLMRLIEEADFYNVPEHTADQFTSDEYKFTISVNSEQASHTVHTSDHSMPKHLLPLTKELTMLKILHH